MGTTVNFCICCGSKNLGSNPAVWMPFVADRAMGMPPMEITDDMQLRTVSNGTAYALCKSLYCKDCGHLFADYRFDDEELSRLYENYRSTDYCSLRDHYEPGYALKNASFERILCYRKSVEVFLSDLIRVDRLKVLDWGGDTGRNTPFIDAADVVHIYEPSGVKPEASNAVNVLEPQDFCRWYGLIVLSNVLEHIPWPANTLKTVMNYMSPSSILYVEVPYEVIQYNADTDMNLRQATVKWHWHEHINFFSKASLATLLESCDLKILKSEAQEVDRGETGVSSTKVLRIACKREDANLV